MNVLVTGGARGIGEAISRAFLESGNNVIINYNTSEKNANLLKETYPQAHIIRADVSRKEEVEKMFAQIETICGGADVLVNNAGISISGCFQDMSEAELDRIFACNFKSVFFCCKSAVSYMIKKHSGSIINISSIWGVKGASCEAAYSAAKAAVKGFSEALASELAPSGIRVNCIAPGIIDTDMTSAFSEEEMNELIASTPAGRIGTPEDIANTVLFLADEKSSFITGQTIISDGGFLFG